MNPLDWEAVQRLQRNLHPDHQTAVHNDDDDDDVTTEDTSGAPNHWDTYCQYSRYPVDEPPSSTGVSLGSNLSPPSRDIYLKEAEDEDPDGEPMADEDPELTRKRKELKAIEEQILRKKVAIALKTVEPFVKGTSPQGFSSSEESATHTSVSLKDRVNVILQQRHPVSSLSKVQSCEEKSSSLSKDSLLQADHPLKLRVKAIMKQRCSEPCIIPTNEEAPHVTPPPSRSVTSPAKEENSANQGFQRFLSVLNKGVDMDLLSRIVNDDSADLPLGGELLNIQPPAVENKSDLPFRSESQRSNSGASQPGHSRTNSGERKSQEESLYRLSLPGDDKKESDRRDLCFGSSSRSKSPPAVKKTKKVEEKPKMDEQCAQLQNVLKSLGLSLEAEEMSKLSDRTQERLYGKKNDGMKVDSRGEQESREKGPQRQSRNSTSSSSSSSFSSSSSRSTSRSCSSSPSRPQRSRSRDLKQRRRSKHSRSRSRSRSRDRAQMHRDRDKKDSKETSTYQCPYPPNQTYPHPHPSDSSKFPDYSLSQYSEYHAYNSGSYSAATTSYWTCTQGAIPPSTYPSVHPYPQDTYSHFPDAVAAPNTVYPHHDPLEDNNFLLNPDLSKSEGQTGFTSGPRCLQVISTKQPTQSFVKQVTKVYRTRTRTRFSKKRNKNKKQKQKQMQALLRMQVAPQRSEDNSKAKESEEKKGSRTEEEIKANLRKTLEAFNQRVKQKLTETLAHSEWLKSMERHEHLQTEPAVNPDRPCGPHF